MVTMNQYKKQEDSVDCYLHPDEIFVGVCPLCLNEKLLILASIEQSHRYHYYTFRRISHRRRSGSCRSDSFSSNKPPRNFPKIFALSSLFSRLEFRQSKSEESHDDQHHHYYDAPMSSHSQEDSFISIKFEESGLGSWEKLDNDEVSNTTAAKVEYSKRVIEHAKANANANANAMPQSSSSVRWRKRMGQLFGAGQK